MWLIQLPVATFITATPPCSHTLQALATRYTHTHPTHPPHPPQNPRQELVNLSPEEMASDEKRKQNAKIRQEVAADLVRGQQQQASTDMFQ